MDTSLTQVCVCQIFTQRTHAKVLYYIILEKALKLGTQDVCVSD